MTNRTPLKNGYIIDNYKILDCISEAGNFGLVYRVEDLDKQRIEIRRRKYNNEFQGSDRNPTSEKATVNIGPILAMKEFAPKKYCTRVGSNIIPLQGLKDNPFAWAKERFEREINALKKISHPNIMPIFYGFEANSTIYAVMEYVGSGNLDKSVNLRGRQSIEEWYKWMKPVAEALRYIDRAYNINHLDISPDNIMFRKDGTPVIIDFGFARIGDKATNNKSKIVKNAHYSAPEKEEFTSSKLSCTSDIYSLAAVSLYALTGQDPPNCAGRISKGQEGGVASAMLAHLDVPNPVRIFLDKAFHLKKDMRHQSWDEFLNAARLAMSSPLPYHEPPAQTGNAIIVQPTMGLRQAIAELPMPLKLLAVAGLIILIIIFL